MRLKILLPEKVLVDEEATSVIVEAADGSIGIKPRRSDFVTSVVSGILAYFRESGEEVFVATGDGTLVKIGEEILVSVHYGIVSSDLEVLKNKVREFFEEYTAREGRARQVSSRLEVSFYKRMVEMG